MMMMMGKAIIRSGKGLHDSHGKRAFGNVYWDYGATRNSALFGWPNQIRTLSRHRCRRHRIHERSGTPCTSVATADAVTPLTKADVWLFPLSAF